MQNNQDQNHLQVPNSKQYGTAPTNTGPNDSFLGNNNSTISQQTYKIETPEEHAARILKRQHRIHVGLAAVGGAVISGSIVYSIMFSMYNPAQAQQTASNISDAFSSMAVGAWNFIVNLSFLGGIFVGIGIERSNVVGRVKRFVTGSKSHKNQILSSDSQVQNKEIRQM